MDDIIIDGTRNRTFAITPHDGHLTLTVDTTPNNGEEDDACGVIHIDNAEASRLVNLLARELREAITRTTNRSTIDYAQNAYEAGFIGLYAYRHSLRPTIGIAIETDDTYGYGLFEEAAINQIIDTLQTSGK
jgi:hypothetical protein